MSEFWSRQKSGKTLANKFISIHILAGLTALLSTFIPYQTQAADNQTNSQQTTSPQRLPPELILPVEKSQEDATAELLNLKSINERLEELLRADKKAAFIEMIYGDMDTGDEQLWNMARYKLQYAVKGELKQNLQSALKDCDFSRAERWINASPTKSSIKKRIDLHRKQLIQLNKEHFKQYGFGIDYLTERVNERSYEFLIDLGQDIEDLTFDIESAQKARQESEQLNNQAKQAYRQARQQENLGDLESARASFKKAEQSIEEGLKKLGDEICVDNQITLKKNLAKVQQRLANLDGKTENDSSDPLELPGSRSPMGIASTGSFTGNELNRRPINADEGYLQNQWMKETDGGKTIQQTEDWWPEDKPVTSDCDVLKQQYNESLKRAYQSSPGNGAPDFSSTYSILNQAANCDWYARGVENLSQNTAAIQSNQDRCQSSAADYRFALQTGNIVLGNQALELGAECDWISSVATEVVDYFQLAPDQQYRSTPTTQFGNNTGVDAGKCSAFKRDFIAVLGQKDLYSAQALIAENSECEYADTAKMNLNIANIAAPIIQGALPALLDAYLQQQQFERKNKASQQRSAVGQKPVNKQQTQNLPQSRKPKSADTSSQREPDYSEMERSIDQAFRPLREQKVVQPKLNVGRPDTGPREWKP